RVARRRPGSPSTAARRPGRARPTGRSAPPRTARAPSGDCHHSYRASWVTAFVHSSQGPQYTAGSQIEIDERLEQLPRILERRQTEVLHAECDARGRAAIPSDNGGGAERGHDRAGKVTGARIGG